MQALVNGISIEDETGLDTIVTFVMYDMHNPPHSVIKAIPLHLFTPRPEDDTIDGYILNAETISSDCEALPSGLHQNSIAQNLKSSVSSMAKSETPKQVDDTTKRRNTCLILGCLADKLIGPRSDLLFQGTVQEFLLAQLADEDTHPAIILHALIALEKFAKTNVNKTKIMGALDADPNLLTKFECWKNSDNSLQAQVAFCAEWALDNVLVTSNREFGCQQVDPSNNYVILNTDNATEYIKISPDGLESRCDSEYFESVRSTGCAGFSGMDSGVWYYEVELVTDGIMQIGWATRDASLLNQDQDGVGDDGQSIGYDGFRRIIWQNGRRQTLEETPKWKPGDVVGTILDFNEPVVQFYLNGIRVATNNTVFETARGGFNAAASFCNLQQCKFNFGSKPFKFSHLTPHSKFECFNDYAAKLGNNCRLVLPKQVSRVDLRTLSVNENENACILCFDNTANTRLSPCLHDHFCSMCLDRLDDKWTCPLCRQDIIEKVLMNNNVDTTNIQTNCSPLQMDFI